MALRKVIKIDEDLCNGCGLCIPNCPEGAIKIIDNKARLIGDLFCDGLGACIGHCPVGAITIEEREAEEYNEEKVMENIIKQGKNTIIEHLKHLKEHNEKEYLKIALDVLEKKGIEIEMEEFMPAQSIRHQGCPGMKVLEFNKNEKTSKDYYESGKRKSELKQWPIQLHLVPPTAPYYKGKDVLLVADCVGYAIGDFHKDHMRNKSIAIACPKLDSNQEFYIEKIAKMIDEAQISSLTVMVMEVPCCSGLVYIAKEALKKAKRKIQIKSIVVSITGEILEETVN